MDKLQKSYSLKVFCFFIASISNIFIIAILSLYSNNILLEFFKWTQLIMLLILIILYLKKINSLIAISITGLIYSFYLILIIYFVQTSSKLSFFFLKRSFGDITLLLKPYLLEFFLILLISLINIIVLYYFIQKINSKKVTTTLNLIIIPIIVLQFFTPPVISNELTLFVQSAHENNEIIDYYQNFYKELINNSIQNRESILNKIHNIDNSNLPKYLDNIIILQIESLNGFLVDEKNTPNLIKASQEGMSFSKFYSNSVQTILGQENILCSLPSSFDLNLVNNPDYQEVLCLPEIFQNLDYKTFFLKTYNLNFSKTGKLMNGLQFDEVHAEDIMQEGDTRYPWGYQDDIFYVRAFDYIKENKEQNNFAYIEVGPINHWPFHTPDALKNESLIPEPKNHKERLVNTTYLQDKFLETAFSKLDEVFPEKNYTLLILGDHSWPAEMHPGNNFNERNAYEENFRTFLTIIVGNEQKYKNIKINTPHSHLDILPSILDLFSIDYPMNNFQKSFFQDTKEENKKILLIQPYADQYINIISDNTKYQYNNTSQQILLYSGEEEIEYEIISKTKEENLLNMQNLLK